MVLNYNENIQGAPQSMIADLPQSEMITMPDKMEPT